MNTIVVVCIVLVLVGALVALRWGHLGLVAPWTLGPDGGADPDRGDRVLRALWVANVHLSAAFGTGVLVIGPGGRLVMRLLAVTAGDAAQGRITEADQIVGKTTLEGTIGLMIFVGLFGGVVVAAFFAALRKWLPAGRAGALALTLISAVALATRTDPLRPSNPDFRLVGPGWLAVTTFLALGLLAFLTFTAIAGRVSRSLRLPERSVRGLIVYLPLVLLAPLALGSALLFAVSAVAVGLLSNARFRAWWAAQC